MIKAHWKHFEYTTRHKWYVFLECCKYGLIYQGIVHDLSKYTPYEWKPYVDYYFLGKNKEEKDILRFQMAWTHHHNANPHHWQYWVGGYNTALPMPDRYRKEMLADWRGASKAKKELSMVAWYLNNSDTIILHPKTRKWIENELKI